MRFDEIRINNQFTQLLTSTFKGDEITEEALKGDSTPEFRKKILFTEDYLKKVIFRRNQTIMQNQILPPNCRYLEKTTNGHIVVIEEPPAFRTVFLDLDLTWEKDLLREKGKLEEYGYQDFSPSSRPHSLNLAFPYVVYFYFIDDNFMTKGGSIFFRTSQIMGLSDHLFKANLFNIGSGQAICFGGNLNKRQPVSLTAGIQDALRTYWTTQFNTDYSYNYRAYNEVPFVSTYLEWQYRSRTDPMFIYNVEWLLYEHNIESEIDKFRNSYSMGKLVARKFSFLDLVSFGTKSVESGIEQVKLPRQSKPVIRKIIYDATDTLLVNSRDQIKVGDMFLSRAGREIYIMSYASAHNTSSVIKMLVSLDGKRCVYKITSKLKDFISKQIINNKYISEYKFPNGLVISADKILITKDSFDRKVYKKIQYLRKSPDGQIEARIGSDYLLVNSIEQDKIEFFDENNISFYNYRIIKGQKYITCGDFAANDTYASSGSLCNYESIDVNTQGKMTLIFRESYSSTKDYREVFKYPLEEKNKTCPVIPFEICRELSNTFISGRRLEHLKSTYDLKFKKELAWTSPEGLIYGRYASHKGMDIHVAKSLISDNKFTLDSAQIPIEFNIGDKVIAVDWKNPISVLTVKILTGFVIDEKSCDVSFVLQDKSGNLSKELYIKATTREVASGKIRRVTNQYEKLTTGMKIVANETSIPMFPKKDVNIIIAFILDVMPEPLVLCSNGMTLWYSDVISKFKIIKMTSKKWAKLQHVPLDPSKIKFQAGDIINCAGRYNTDMGYFLFYDKKKYASLLAQPIQYYDGYPEVYTFSRMVKESYLDCIPMPRIYKEEEENAFNGFIDCHTGMVQPTSRSSYQFYRQHPSQDIAAGQNRKDK